MKSLINKNDNKGFTLIEVIAILIILGILAAVAVGRVGDNQADLITSMDTFKSHMRYIQARAMNSDSNTIWGIRIIEWQYSTPYYLFCIKKGSGVNAWDLVARHALPGSESDGSKRNFLVDGIKIKDDSFFIFTSEEGTKLNCIYFDHYGKPYRDKIPNSNPNADPALPTSPLTATYGSAVTFQDTSGNTRTLNITPETGYID